MAPDQKPNPGVVERYSLTNASQYSSGAFTKGLRRGSESRHLEALCSRTPPLAWIVQPRYCRGAPHRQTCFGGTWLPTTRDCIYLLGPPSRATSAFLGNFTPLPKQASCGSSPAIQQAGGRGAPRSVRALSSPPAPRAQKPKHLLGVGWQRPGCLELTYNGEGLMWGEAEAPVTSLPAGPSAPSPRGISSPTWFPALSAEWGVQSHRSGFSAPQRGWREAGEGQKGCGTNRYWRRSRLQTKPPTKGPRLAPERKEARRSAAPLLRRSPEAPRGRSSLRLWPKGRAEASPRASHGCGPRPERPSGDPLAPPPPLPSRRTFALEEALPTEEGVRKETEARSPAGWSPEQGGGREEVWKGTGPREQMDEEYEGSAEE